MKNNQAILTKAGAERILRPDLEGAIVEYERVHERFGGVMEVTYQGKRVAGALSFKGTDGESPSVRLIP